VLIDLRAGRLPVIRSVDNGDEQCEIYDDRRPYTSAVNDIYRINISWTDKMAEDQIILLSNVPSIRAPLILYIMLYIYRQCSCRQTRSCWCAKVRACTCSHCNSLRLSYYQSMDYCGVNLLRSTLSIISNLRFTRTPTTRRYRGSLLSFNDILSTKRTQSLP